MFRGKDEGDMVRYAVAKPEPLRVELERFRDAVRGENEVVMSMREGLRVLEVADAVAASAASGGALSRLDSVGAQ